jgi:hypothetical protein
MTSLDLYTKAISEFELGNYAKSLFMFATLNSQDPSEPKYLIHSIICDIVNENEIEAKRLHDYFLTLLSQEGEDAVKTIIDTINIHDKHKEQSMESIEISSYENSIHYTDFLNLVDKKGSFKIAYQNIMFATEVLIPSEDAFVHFVDSLIENGFLNSANKYLNNASEVLVIDKKLLDVLNKKLKEYKFDSYS